MSSLECPKCQGPREAKALYCAFCGVIFSRYSAAVAADSAPSSLPALTPVLAAAGALPLQPSMAPAPRPAETGSEGPPSAEWNPYSGPRSPLPGQPRPDAMASLELATRSSRLVAQTLNGIGLTAVALLFALPGILMTALNRQDDAGGVVLLVGIFTGALFWLVTNLRQLAQTGQSLGKKWMQIRVATLEGEKPGLGQLVVMRYLSMQLLGAIPVAGPFVGLADALMIFGEEQRCLHDRIAGTVVLKA